MVSYQFNYESREQFCETLNRIKKECDKKDSKTVLFYLTWTELGSENLNTALELIEEYFADSIYYGSESSGNIVNGKLDFGVSVTCYFFEKTDSRVKMIWVEQGTEVDSLDKLWELCNKEEGLRAVELAPSMSYVGILDIDNSVPDIDKDIIIFGGASVCSESMKIGAKVVAKGHPITEDGLSAILYFGNDLNISATYVLGWKGLGRYMKVTKSHDKIIEEIDGTPAFTIYEKYLNIKQDDEANLVFPLNIVEDGVEYIRTPQYFLPDKSMRMFANISEGSYARLAYGDKNTIIKSLYEKTSEIAEYDPQILKAFSCTARRLFWGDDEINKETLPLTDIAPIAGYYTGGEILRIKEKLRVMNSTLVVISFREGEAGAVAPREQMTIDKTDKSLLSRITHFVEVVSKEQEEALEIANEEKRRNDILHDIIHSGKWSFYVNDKDEITNVYYSENLLKLIDNDFSDKIKVWSDVLHPDDKDATLEKFMATIKDHSCNTPYDVTYRMVNRDGEYHWFHSAGRIVRDKNGDGEFFGIHIDITEQIEKQIKEQQMLEEALVMADSANHAKTEFLFNMSHDIRTPMNAILGFTNIAMKHMDDREKTYDCLVKTQQSGELLLSLINNVLEVSRIESGKASVDANKGDIYLSFSNIEDTMSVMAEAKDITLTFEYRNIVNRYVVFDFNRCARVFVNIISNAIKYTNEGGYVKVVCEQAGKAKKGVATYKYTFEDNGIGMSREFQKHVFEQFAREKSVTMTGIQGTGLGMAVCKSFVELMGGTIVCKSTLGKGTLFTVTLPFAIRDEDEPADIQTGVINDSKKIDFHGKKVLLTEDNELNREIAVELLEDEGFEVEEADDGSKAVEMLKEKGPDYYDIILMDIQMPVMGGYDATRKIRKMYPNSNIPIIALSANAFAEDKSASMEAGMDDHIAKPINTDELLRALKKYVRAKKNNESKKDS